MVWGLFVIVNIILAIVVLDVTGTSLRFLRHGLPKIKDFCILQNMLIVELI